MQKEVQYRLVGDDGDSGRDHEGDGADDHTAPELAEVLSQRHAVRRRTVLPFGREGKRHHGCVAQFRVGSPGTTTPEGWGARNGRSAWFGAGAGARAGAGGMGAPGGVGVGASASDPAEGWDAAGDASPSAPATPVPAAAVPFSEGSVGGWNDPSGASSEDMFER